MRSRVGRAKPPILFSRFTKPPYPLPRRSPDHALGSGPLSWIETFVTFCGMVGLQAMVLGRLGRKPFPHPRACALSCPSPFAGRGSTGLRSFRYHALRGNPSGEEVRDDPHSDNRSGSNRCSVAPTAAPLRPQARPGLLIGAPALCRGRVRMQ